MGHQTISRLNQPPRYYLFFPHERFSNMNNCPPNQRRTSHLAETMCCVIPGNVSTGVAELALITAQARTADVHSAQTPL